MCEYFLLRFLKHHLTALLIVEDYYCFLYASHNSLFTRITVIVCDHVNAVCALCTTSVQQQPFKKKIMPETMPANN